MPFGGHQAVYERRGLRSWPPSDKRGVNLIGDALLYSPLWYRGPNSLRDAIGYAKFNSRLHHVLIRVYDEAGNVIETKPLTPTHAMQSQ
jgi:hypothetical protein